MSASGRTSRSSSRLGGRRSVPEATPEGRRRSRWALAGIVLLVVAVAAATVMVGSVVRNGGSGDRRGPVSIVTLDPSPTREERVLLDHIPLVVEVSDATVTWVADTDCRRGPASGRIVASFECILANSGAEGVTYSLFANRGAMDRAYARGVDAARVERFTGSCANGPPAEGNWQSHFSGSVGSVLPDGRVLCFRRAGIATFVWTSSHLLILSTASSSGGWKALHRFWSEVAGPFE